MAEKIEHEYFGKVTVVHSSGICETESGFNIRKEGQTEKGDHLVKVGKKFLTIKPKVYTDAYKGGETNREKTPKKGVTKALLETAAALGIVDAIDKTKAALETEINEIRAEVFAEREPVLDIPDPDEGGND